MIKENQIFRIAFMDIFYNIFFIILFFVELFLWNLYRGKLLNIIYFSYKLVYCVANFQFIIYDSAGIDVYVFLLHFNFLNNFNHRTPLQKKKLFFDFFFRNLKSFLGKKSRFSDEENAVKNCFFNKSE